MIDFYDIADILSFLEKGETVQNDDFYKNIEDLVYERYETDLDTFEKIVKDLLTLVVAGKSPLTGEIHVGLGYELKDGTGCFIYKKEK